MQPGAGAGASGELHMRPTHHAPHELVADPVMPIMTSNFCTCASSQLACSSSATHVAGSPEKPTRHPTSAPATAPFVSASPPSATTRLKVAAKTPSLPGATEAAVAAAVPSAAGAQPRAQSPAPRHLYVYPMLLGSARSSEDSAAASDAGQLCLPASPATRVRSSAMAAADDAASTAASSSLLAASPAGPPERAAAAAACAGAHAPARGHRASSVATTAPWMSASTSPGASMGTPRSMPRTQRATTRHEATHLGSVCVAQQSAFPEVSAVRASQKKGTPATAARITAPLAALVRPP
mmetsp:Transcript_8663/g.23816  ORF Transcript_8663/g.23816 Transcript_8663/m.23816 type:complete len:296 (+) Transcript_8663:439-1326(+)